MKMTDYNHLFELNELAVKEAKQYPKRRELYNNLLGDSGRHFIGVTGPRGVGKTVILKQIAAKTQNAFYLSLDTIEDDDDLFEIAKTLSERYGFKRLLFEDYLKGGLYPFSLEEPRVLPLLENVIQKILQKDIPSVAKLRLDEISLIEKVIKFIGRSGVDGINYSSISSNLKITKYKAESYISLLKNAFVLHVLFPTGTNVLREPKVLMCLPFRLLYRSYDDAVGGLREDFTVEMLCPFGRCA
jgi:predicted AAA+ superfamily ATPase